MQGDETEGSMGRYELSDTRWAEIADLMAAGPGARGGGRGR